MQHRSLATFIGLVGASVLTGCSATDQSAPGPSAGSAGAAGAAGEGGSASNVDAASDDARTSGASGSGGVGAAAVSVDTSGHYTVTFAQPAWTFGGGLGADAAEIAATSGTDAVGAYHETSFSYTKNGARRGRIRAYDEAPVVIFGETNLAAADNIRNFPVFSTLPAEPAFHLAYQDVAFAGYSFSELPGGSPWVFFDGNANTFIISSASHFMNAETSKGTDGNLAVGIASQIAALPAGFETTAVLVVEPGINRAFEDWGATLMKLGGKRPIPNDATPELLKFGYWTDNGATYYYDTQSGADYRTTLENVRSYYEQLGTPIGYIQLDSWWYPKGAADTWQGSGTNRGGTYVYEGDTTLFPDGLAAFQQAVGVPLVTHNRWLDPASPYRSMYKMSGNVSVDPAFWTHVASYLKSSGVSTYEQDWLDNMALPSTSNLTDQDAFTDNMADAMAAAGIGIQYCMPLPRHYLQSSKYQNLVTSRVSEDRFDRSRWRTFFYTSRLASAVGLWPWTDVFLSGERDNLLLSTLTGGIVGVGDAINAADKTSIVRAMRADGVLIKPDRPILLLDRVMVAEAQGQVSPSIATTYSDHTGGRTTYVFGFTDASASLSFTPAELGYSGSVYVYDPNRQSGQLLTSEQPQTDSITDTAYYIVSPVGPSGIAFIGEQGKIAATGKKRIDDWSDDGTLSVSVAFAPGEPSVTLMGYAPTIPTASASAGAVGPIQYDSASKLFDFSVTPSGAAPFASVRLHR